jgi:hypothetical protein
MVIFKEEGHKYFNDITGVEYTSVTTLISKYKKPFNNEFWSVYKALEKVLPSENFKKWKPTFMSFQYDKDLTKINKCLTTHFSSYKEQVFQVKSEIVKEWDGIKNVACEKGTKFHKSQEEKVIKDKGLQTNITFFPLGLLYGGNVKLENGVYPELILFNDEYAVCGTSDLVFIDNGFVDVDDYKTNKAINKKSYKFADGKYQMMLAPINHLFDCNFYHYNLQLSMYMYFLECNGYIPRNLKFTHYIIGEDGNERAYDYPVKYLKEEVIAILKDFKSKK